MIKNMTAPSVVKCFICIYIFLAAVNYGDSSNTIEEMNFPGCSRMCYNTRSVNDTNVPLFMCSCSPGCSTFGDCCYDSDYRSKITQKKIDFICLSVFNRTEYKAIAGCPASQHAEFCKSGIGIMPPVTSRVTNITYANIFCAHCNEDGEDLAVWNVELRCAAEEGDAEFYDDSTKIKYENRQLWSVSETTGQRRYCKYHAHFDDFTLLDSLELRICSTGKTKSTCSPQWKNSEIKELCRSYEDPVYFGSTAFRNMHCAECNYMNLLSGQCLPSFMEDMLQKGQYNSSLQQFCSQRGSVACVKHLSDTVGRGRGTSFSNLLNIYEEGCIPDDGERCCPHEAYDYRSKQCRKIETD